MMRIVKMHNHPNDTKPSRSCAIFCSLFSPLKVALFFILESLPSIFLCWMKQSTECNQLWIAFTRTLSPSISFLGPVFFLILLLWLVNNNRWQTDSKVLICRKWYYSEILSNDALIRKVEKNMFLRSYQKDTWNWVIFSAKLLSNRHHEMHKWYTIIHSDNVHKCSDTNTNALAADKE